ncbi:aldehyde dehydrogenase [Effusibacillus lacus]|nr:aldehyde dehydrogenase [Effusibacillus lacus]TCS76466.1 acyl-CoA reductase-like NAD-dependent aldehyde dehydrogenase [Effusibacillus lacus]
MSSTLPTARLFINGEFCMSESGKTLEVINPATGEVIGHLSAADKVDVNRAVKAAKDSFESGVWSQISGRERAKVLNRFADLFEANLEELYRLETLNNGRPISETRAQISRLPDFFRYFAAEAWTHRDAVVPIEGPYLHYIQRIPLGVCALMTSFNHPLMILSKSLAPALATGNSVVIKPSEQTPFTTVRLVELLIEAGIPKGVVNLINGLGIEAGAPLADHPDVKKVVFTGGTEVGRSIGKSAANHFAKMTLELGGKGAVIIFDDMDLKRAVDGASFAAFIGAGQTCVCGSRILVQRSIYNKFLEAFKTKVNSIRYGDPFDPKTQLGPVISARSLDRILKMLDTARNQGAKVLTGGKVPTDAPKGGFFLEPTVFYDVTPEMEIANEEVFGPVTVVMPFDEEEDAIQIANGTRYGLAAGVWTNDVARSHRVASKLIFGMVWIQDHHRLDPASPWGGFKDSGVGRETGKESFEHFTETRAVTVNITGQTVDWYSPSDQPKRLN